MYDKISSIRNATDDISKRCGKEKETLIHAMKDCPKVRAVLEFDGLNNKFLDGGYSRAPWERAAALSRDFRIFNLVEDPFLPRKIGKKVFYGLVARDADGFVHGGRMGFVDKDLLIKWAELLAMEESLKITRLNNWKDLELESDYASLVNRFNKRNNGLTLLGYHLREIHR
ncbi:hypothetical protein Gotur_014103, partial [Gossypium turneri]